MAHIKSVQSACVPTPASAYSQCIEARGDRTVFISGQVPVTAEGELVGDGDIRAQATQVFENIKALVEQAGGSMSNIVKLTIFLTDIAHFGEFAQVRSRYLQEPYPAASLVQVAGLVSPDWLVEVEAIAVL